MMTNKRILLVSLLLVLAAVNLANAQSQDRDSPTPLSENKIKGTGTGKKVEYYYSFTAGPGEVVVTVDLKAKAGSTNADLEIFDGEESKIFYYYPNATTQNERAVKRVTLSGKQPLTLRLALDNNAGEYSIKLAGPVELAAPTPVPAPMPDAGASGADASTTPSPAEEQPQPATSTPEPDASIATPTEVSTPKPGKLSKLDFGMNILQAVGTQFGLPTSGMLHIVMKDGTTQDIDLSKVKTASVKKQ